MGKYRPTLLIIRDGWGSNHDAAQDAFNAIKLAKTPVCDKLSLDWPRTEIIAHGPDVGLPEGVMGNSEVGHQNIGAGRIVDQEIVRIGKGLAEIEDNPAFKANVQHVLDNDAALHFMGLISDAGVHSLLDHLLKLIDAAARMGVSKIYIHAITDGRDTPPESAIQYIEAIESHGIGRIASVCGRFWAMDRDERWERVEAAYNCFTGASSTKATSAQEAVLHYYQNPEEPSRRGDEFVTPTIIVDGENRPTGPIQSGDSVIFFNFRGDRPREITRAFIEKAFVGFEREMLQDLHYTTMTEYQTGLCPSVLFRKAEKMQDILGMYVAEHNIPQFRCAETEKYPHVTFFFNDYREEPFPGEARALVPSPKDVSTYDQKPEMSAPKVTEAAKEAILSGEYGLIIVNFANTDMVGHTGSLKAAITAAEVVDKSVGTLLEALDQVDGAAIITADHGNADQMWEPGLDTPHTRHTLNPVEVIIYGKDCESLTLRPTGRLADIAPTLLALMDLPQPPAMTGQSLIKSN